MKKNLKYFEDELSRLSKEFAEFKKKHIGKLVRNFFKKKSV